ncbi:MAG TPA: ATP-binding protein [Gaiellaceae bacterium]|nr:ATP-binding protein [Gaiellaceae bacterium]
MLASRQPIPARAAFRAELMRPLAVLGAAVTLAAVGGGIALEELAGTSHLVAGGPTTLAVSVGLFGALLLWLRPRNRIGVLLLVTGVGFGIGVLASGTLDYGARGGGVPHGLEQAAFAWIWVTAALNTTWTLLILWFPDGTFPSPGWRRYFVVSTAVNVAVALCAYLAGPGIVYDFFSGTSVPAGVHGPFAGEALRPLVKVGDLILLFPLIALAGLARRYRSASPVVRQQIKWLIVSAAVGIALQLVGLPLTGRGGTAWAIGAVLSMLGQPVTVVGATVGILRYRLWEIEIVVSRALVYGVLWLALSLLLLVPALATGLLVGGPGALAAVGLALLVALAFQPARRRLELLAERLVYRRAQPHVLLTGFWETLRTTTELERVGELVAGAVREGLAVEWAGTWLYVESGGAGALDPFAVDGAEPGPPAVLSADVIRQLRDSPGLVLAGEPAAELAPLWPAPPAAVVPLVGGEELVGLLACGPRRGDPLGAADFELLELLARECALRLRNLRLERQLRERLVQIEAQAEELRGSRQRLVTAQDEERRRIERNLHDGVQQQLVSLAVRLQRAAADGQPLLRDLAVEAEQAIFALQELGRGIFPGVLADQGLPAALRTQAARMPLTVRVEVDAELAGRRLDPDLEAALYFVALEALTNAQKHAPEASASLWLRTDKGRVVLEVSDDGPGFDRPGGGGSGLQNMADRIAAAGGTLSVESRPGAGTHVRATAPLLVPQAEEARVVPIGRRG